MPLEQENEQNCECAVCGRTFARESMRECIMDGLWYCEPCVMAPMKEAFRQFLEADTGMPVKTVEGDSDAAGASE